MNISKSDKLHHLLTQLEMSEDDMHTYFKDAYLDKLEVYRQQKLWHFHLTVQQVLPIEIYQLLVGKLQHTFQHTAAVEVTIKSVNPDCEEALICDYWRMFLQTSARLSPAYKDLVENQTPKLEHKKLLLTARNEAEASALKKRVEEGFRQYCTKAGLPQFTLEINIDQSALDLESFREQKALEDKQLVMKTMRDKEKRDQNRMDQEQNKPFAIGYQIQDEPMQMEDIQDEERRVAVQGYVFAVEIRKLRSGRSLLIAKATDYTDSLQIKMFSKDDEDAAKFEQLKKGMWIKARGSIQTDMYTNELAMMANDLMEVKVELRKDEAPEGEKRVELHAHSTMSQLDAVVSPARLVEQAAKWGHSAIAITDHAAVQGFPEAHGAAQKHDMKVIYGVEANIVDDGVPIAYNEKDLELESATYVVFDVETTGLSAIYDTIIELAGVKIQNGEIIDRFESFANPHKPISQTITDLTGITDDMVRDAPEVEDVLKDFYEWSSDSALVAHNASFDIGFLNQGYKRIDYNKVENPVIDTLELARFLFPELRNHRLNTLCKLMDVELTQHHRAIYDAEATGYLFWKMIRKLIEKDITNHIHLNDHMGEGDAYQRSRPYHCTLLAQNEEGLKNLYKLVSYAHIDYFYRVPRIPRSLLQKYRAGLLVGTACDQGEVFETMMQKSAEEAESAAEFYDYIEVQPPANYAHLIEKELVKNEAQLLEIITKLVDLGKQMDKLVVATGNVHYIDDHEKLYRQILIASQAGNPLNRQTLSDTPFRTTNEMLTCFSFLGDELAKEIVVTNTNALADQIEAISPVKSGLFTPKIDGAEEEIKRLCYERAEAIYGNPVPKIVTDRLEKELKSIIDNGFAVIYLISHKLVKKSLDDGYLVGSRGSVGSSLVATMTEITEVNPLPPHYVCESCNYHEFITDGSYGSGFDLPDKSCPNCSSELLKDGQDIPFETFLGFKGDKVPDIDLNFSGEYQPMAHHYTKELFGEDYVYRAGTIGTIAEKTAFGYVKGYASDHQLVFKNAEVERLVQGCAGVKRTTGQHPGGIIVVPDNKEIFDFTPIQFPANDRNSEWRTTHFDFHSIDENLLKLDILGHDDPTVIRMLQDLSGMDPKTIPIDDEAVMKIFSGTESLGVTPEQIDCKTGTLGVPEFGTRFVRQMLEDTKPNTFSELVIISGLSHGTDVWLGNAQELINEGICELPDVIGCRDDIMVYLMHQGLEASLAFKIMESVRKGRGLQDEWIVEMKKTGVPDWYIESCKKIKYMFPKAHAAAYVLMAVRIAYFKVHHPILFYAAYFTVRASDFELDTMIKGSAAIKQRIDGIIAKGNDASPKEKSLLTVLEISLEMCERGFSFKKVDLYQSSATEFLVDGNALIPPFNAVDGLGTNAAINIVEARKKGEFLSKEDLRERSKISKTVLEYLDQHGCLEGMEEKNQLSLF
ncbi:PolC-type DNA polymerase III [Ornithinibacillus gellani]|uniref:PolC-type DNA polymerase III n=1 Tax=Ornithinibacillus gellani TaxID=2293253 RepID=UPI000F49ABA4|nr:PolC-type DNA polymerase III [Ornithinibacillus gellani]TQS75525.1 PolC-type DNA polymerase III [Ornithinibacillus gellani]